MRYDLAFFLCCCKSFLGSDPDDPDSESNYYQRLGVDRDASAEEIKRAYKRQSLQMHPDKLAQRGLTATEEDQAKFTRMKEAYEILSDPHKKETYDAIGERGMKWMEEPFSIDPQELAHNFATSSVVDRSKIFAIFVALAVAVLLLPLLVCFHVDGAFGPHASWLATFTPLWLWDVFILFYHSRVIMMGPIPRPDHIPPEEWVDPLPMKKRIFSLVRFLLIVMFEILVCFKLDNIVRLPWFVIFFPLYVWEATTLYKKWPLARMRIVTVEDLEAALGKPFHQFTPAEKELIGKRYSVVPSTESPDFDAAQKLKTRARHDIIKSVFRILFVAVLLVQIDLKAHWNWWLVFLPFWFMTFLICYSNYQSFAEVQRMAAEKDPTLFGMKDEETGDAAGAGTAGAYGAVGSDGAATAAAAKTSDLSEQEREELKAQVMASSSRLCSKCCSQGFLLLVVFLFVAKLQGAGFSAVWIISPFLFVAGLILLCLGFAIFGITEVPADGLDFDAADFAEHVGVGSTVGTTSAPGAHASASATAAQPIYVPPPPPQTTTPSDATSPVILQPPTSFGEALGDTPTASALLQRGAVETKNEAAGGSSRVDVSAGSRDTAVPKGSQPAERLSASADLQDLD